MIKKCLEYLKFNCWDDKTSGFSMGCLSGGLRRNPPFKRSPGVGQRSIIYQKTGRATFPDVLFRSITAINNFHGSSRTASRLQGLSVSRRLIGEEKGYLALASVSRDIP